MFRLLNKGALPSHLRNVAPISRTCTLRFMSSTKDEDHKKEVRVNNIKDDKRITDLTDVRYVKGDRIHGYIVDRVFDVTDLYIKCVELTHTSSGAKHFHVAKPDPDNVFSVAFKTPPEHSGGTTHVLEHVALCGSKRYDYNY